MTIHKTPNPNPNRWSLNPPHPMLFNANLHTDPKSEANLVCQSVCVFHFEDEMTRDRSPRVQVVWVLVVFKLFRRPLLPARCSRSVFSVLGKF